MRLKDYEFFSIICMVSAIIFFVVIIHRLKIIDNKIDTFSYISIEEED